MSNALEFTGNPFVDSGLAVMTRLTGHSNVSEMTFADVAQLVGDGSALARYNSRHKSFTMVFGTNGVLTQPAYKKAGQNELIYKAIVRRLLDAAEQEGSAGNPCELTGILTRFDFHAMCASALAEAGQKTIPERKWIGRDWVPLAGSLGNDAQALPAASRPLHVSATALLALQYLPLGLFLHQGRLACYQCTDPLFMQKLTADVVEDNRVRMKAGNVEILGKGEGSSVVLSFLLGRFEELQNEKATYNLPPNTTLFLWLFSNSGTGADCRVLEIPDLVLHFLWDACLKEYSSEIRRLVAGEPKDPRQQFFAAIRERRDYRDLYPSKKSDGTSQEFYEFYQNRIRGWSGTGLAVARRIARHISEGADPKRLKELRKPEAFNKVGSSGRSAVRGYIADHMELAEYDALFPTERHPIRAKGDGWQLIRFYLAQLTIQETPLPDGTSMTTTHPKIPLIAEEYFRKRGPKRVKSLLDRLKRGSAGIPWLRDVFCEMAETHPEFELGEWDEFVCNEEGRPITYELLFQIRLRLANLYRQSSGTKEETP